jgi:hypothetical protein
MEMAVENCMVAASENIYSNKTDLTGSETFSNEENEAWIDAIT